MGDLVTTALDIVGLLLVAAGFGWWMWDVASPPAGIMSAGLVIGLVSAVAAARSARQAESESAAPVAAEAPDGSA